MAIFQYQARAADNKVVSGLVEAQTEAEAAKLLHDKRLFVINLKQNRNQATLDIFRQYFQKVGFNDIVNFTRQLSTMVVAGLSLPETFTILRSQTTNTLFVTMLEDVEHQIVSGQTLADALSKYPQMFPTSYIALIRAGESSDWLTSWNHNGSFAVK
jgi:type IV pilus assembly protein PilC